MLKATVNDGNVSISASGSLRGLLADTLHVINCVHESIYNECNKVCAQGYREMPIKAVTDPESGLWSTTDSEKCDAQPIQQEKEPTVKVGTLDLNGCESGEDAAKALVSLLRSMGVPIPKNDAEELE